MKIIKPKFKHGQKVILRDVGRKEMVVSKIVICDNKKVGYDCVDGEGGGYFFGEKMLKSPKKQKIGFSIEL